MDAFRRFSTNHFWWTLIALPILIHLVLLWLYSVNAPRLDDFSEGFGFLTHFFKAETLQEKIDWFFYRYQNHRYASLHTIYIYFHGIDFRLITFFSAPWLWLLLWLWYRSTSSLSYQLPLLLTACFLIFNLHSWMGMFWLTASMSIDPSIALALLAFILATKNTTTNTVLAIATALLATFTNGNGVFIWLLVIGYLIFLQIKSPDYRRCFFIVVWIVISTLALSAFFSDWVFHPVNMQEDRVTGFIQKLAENPTLFLKGLFATVGSNLIYYPGQDSDWRVFLAIAVGVIESIIMAWLLLRGAFKNNPPLLLLALYIGATLAAIAASRVLFLGLHQAFQGHYKLYNSIFLLLLCAAWLDVRTQQQKRCLTISKLLAGITGIAYLVSFLLFLPTLDTYHRELVNDTRNWLYTNKLTRGESQLFVIQPNKKLAAAVDGGYYNPWTLLNNDEIPDDIIYSQTCPPNTPITASIQSQLHAHAVKIDLPAIKASSKFCLQGEKQAIYFTVTSENNKEKQNFSLWVPRNGEAGEDKGPWTLYSLP
jgi:hypothetical protein